MDQAVAMAIISVFYLVFLYIAISKRPMKMPRKMAFASGVTYALFLIHARIGKLVFDACALYVNRYMELAIPLICVMALAGAVHFFLERPLSGKIKALAAPLLRMEARLVPRNNALPPT